jgi:hypothetical protein
MDLSTLVLLPVHISAEFFKYDADGRIGGGGVAVCENLLVVSCLDELQVFALPEDIARGGVKGPERELVHVRTLGGAAPMDFKFGNFFWGETGYRGYANLPPPLIPQFCR